MSGLYREIVGPNKADFERRGRIPVIGPLIADILLLGPLRAEMDRLAKTWAAEGLAASAGANLLIGSGSGMLLAASLAEKLGIAHVRSPLQPLDPSRDIPTPLFRPPPVPLPGVLNLAFRRLLRAGIWRFMQRAVNDVRRDLGLAPYPRWAGPWNLHHGDAGPTLYGFSTHVVPRQPEWPERIAIPGYFVLDQAHCYAPSRELEKFLAEGPPPIYVGFGSVLTSDAADLARIVKGAIRQMGRRAIVSNGWTKLGENFPSSDDILVVDDVPHDWLFPRVALAVHHCGAGTTAAAARAGIPSVPVPFGIDMFLWAWQLKRLGVATPRLERRALTVERLVKAIRIAESPQMMSRAAALGEKLRAEDGVDAAIRQLERWGLLPKPALVEDGGQGSGPGPSDWAFDGPVCKAGS
jgi:UDP:flavonoid glycosyltransferase YjiC (YdhE family)